MPSRRPKQGHDRLAEGRRVCRLPSPAAFQIRVLARFSCTGQAAQRPAREPQPTAPPGALGQRRGKPCPHPRLGQCWRRAGMCGQLLWLGGASVATAPAQKDRSGARALRGRCVQEHARGQHEQFPTPEFLLRGGTRRSKPESGSQSGTDGAPQFCTLWKACTRVKASSAAAARRCGPVGLFAGSACTSAETLPDGMDGGAVTAMCRPRPRPRPPLQPRPLAAAAFGAARAAMSQ